MLEPMHAAYMCKMNIKHKTPNKTTKLRRRNEKKNDSINRREIPTHMHFGMTFEYLPRALTAAGLHQHTSNI